MIWRLCVLIHLLVLMTWWSSTYCAGYHFSSDISVQISSTGQVSANTNLESKQNSPLQNSVEICSNALPVPVPCDPDYPYRYVDGSCNNLEHPTWCSSIEPYQRFFPANYAGFGDPRRSVKGGPLPIPREISLNINQVQSYPEKDTSNMLPIFGQFLSHDVSFAQGPEVFDEPKCCGEAKNNSSLCNSILIRADDPYYSEFNVTCIGVKRSYNFIQCKSEKRQQQNGATGSIDVSTTYGANEERAHSVRTKDGTGRLNWENFDGDAELLPVNVNPTEKFCPFGRPRDCFASGDRRANMHAGLTGLHTLFMREHNRLASALKVLNPLWDEEKLYQESRKIVGGEMQCTVYKEFLPLLLGQNAADYFDLPISKPGEATQYNPNVQCGVWNEYAHGVGRLHTIVGSQIGVENLRFEDTIGNSKLLRQGLMKGILQGVCRAAAEMYDRFFVTDIKDHFLPFRFSGIFFSADIMSIDIIRGRDHGLPPYVDMLSFCNGRNLDITEFEELLPYMSWKNILLLKNNYKDVRDVDLWVAAQMERVVPGALLGPTAICIFGRQYRDLKYGDRFYFEHEGEVPSFTPGQRESLKQNCSLSRMLCDNNHQQEQQREAFLLPSFTNPIVSCDQLPQLDVNLWKEN